jgi:ABC-type lipoprotein release transport system permease subunit
MPTTDAVSIIGRFIEHLLFQVSPRDPMVFGVISGTAIIIAAAASLLPAWTASRIHAAAALRTE